MGKNDIAVKRWLSDKNRFADLFNGTVFQGKEIVRAEELAPLERESARILTDKNGNLCGLQRYRDIVMRWKGSADLALLACENQDSVHYGMPIRNMIYDGMTYSDQIEQWWKEGQNKLTKAEYLSRCRKDTKILPVFTLVFYYAEAPWDGTLDLYGMFPEHFLGEERSILEKYVPNYHINLVDAARIENPEQFKSDLQIIFSMLKYRNNKKVLKDFVNLHSDYFSNVDPDTYDAIRSFLHSEKQLKLLAAQEKGEGINMCKALEDLYQDGVDAGMERGIEQGIKQGTKQTKHQFSALLSKLLSDNRHSDLEMLASDPSCFEQLCEQYGIS